MHCVTIGIVIIVVLFMSTGVWCHCIDNYFVVANTRIEPNRQPPAGTNASNVTGTVRIVQAASGGITRFSVNLRNVGPPFTKHGFHVHEYGDIFTQGCQSAGAHYNPCGLTHGAQTDITRHVADLGNLVTDGDGNVVTEFQDHLISLVGPNSVLGRAFVIHADPDDLGRGVGPARAESLITGNAGARLGCGIIHFASPGKLRDIK